MTIKTTPYALSWFVLAAFLAGCDNTGTVAQGQPEEEQEQEEPNEPNEPNEPAEDAAPAITTQPTSQAVSEGLTATLTVVATGSPAPTYQWQRSNDAGATFTDLPGATAASFTTAQLTASDSGARFRVVVQNRAGSVTSEAATITVTQGPAILSFAATPARLPEGGSATLSFEVIRANALTITASNGASPGDVINLTSVTVTPDATTSYTLLATNDDGEHSATLTVEVYPQGLVRIVLLHHSTGGVIWDGGVPALIEEYNTNEGTEYDIAEEAYPSAPYPWENYPYDYWNLWVAHTGDEQDREQENLDQLAAAYDVIVFKHCYPVSDMAGDDDTPDVTSAAKTRANYELQYAALKARMHEFPEHKFIVWTGAANTAGATSEESAILARDFFTWVKDTWDEPGDNIFVWDFWQLETEGGLYLLDDYDQSPTDSHPNAEFAQITAPLLVNRIVDVIEGRGDTGSLTGER